MIESLSAVCRLLAAVSAAVLVGTTVFRALVDHEVVTRQRMTMDATLPIVLLSGLMLIAHLGSLSIQWSLLGEQAGSPERWGQLIVDTHYGRVWLGRTALATLTLVIALMLVVMPRAEPLRWLGALFALAFIGAGPLGGHAAGSEASIWSLLINVIHVLALSIWAGALPAWLLIVRGFGRDRSVIEQSALARTLTRFSAVATGLMALIMVSGLILADGYIDSEGDLLGTRYGALLVAKFLLLMPVLLMAKRLRRNFLPALQTSENASPAARSAARHVTVEIAATAAIFGCAALLGQSTPALHDTAVWWLPFRWSPAATWVDPGLQPWIVISTGCLLAALLVTAMGRSTTMRRCSAVAAALALVTLTWALAVPAYPDSFRRSDVPYLTVSIAEGRTLYLRHCAACHGDGGLGDGPLAASMLRPPANLSQRHTALHTAGDMYWWLSHGIAAGGMPGFDTVLTSSDRWDLINFLRAFSQGFEARLLNVNVADMQPWLGAPNFYLERSTGPAELKAYRESENVLLVFASGAQLAERLHQLTDAYPSLVVRRGRVIVVPLEDRGVIANVPFPVIDDPAGQIWAAYELLSRTVASRGSRDRLGLGWTHVEFLIDRFGYVRARWIPDDQPEGWNKLDILLTEIDRLNAEPRIKPAPDDHVH